MKVRDFIAVSFAAVLLCMGPSPLLAGEHDERAIEVLKAWNNYQATLNAVVIRGTSLQDARLGAGLVVSNSEEITVSLKKPASLHLKQFDGVNTMEIFFHNGQLTTFDSGLGYYAQADVPKDLGAALDFSLEEMGVDAPLMDLVRANVFDQLAEIADSILYLSDQSLVAGAYCHQIAIRGTDLDVQLWIQKGEIPVPRRIMITNKWEGGAPRFVAEMDWTTAAKIDDSEFVFKAPEGARQIEFITSLDRRK